MPDGNLLLYAASKLKWASNEVLEECLGKKAKMEMLPLQAGDVPDTEADVSDLITNVGYRPKVSVEEGVANFVRWYKEYYSV